MRIECGSCNKWWCENILNNDDFSKEQENITPTGESEVFFLPYLMGERSPHNDPSARSCFIGMNMSTSRSVLTLAVLEGVAFALRDSYEIAKKLGIKIERTKICGGGAKSKLWKKIIANVLNIKVDVIANEQGPSLGAAILASVGCGEFKDVKEAAEKIVKISETIIPDSELTEKYNKSYERYKKLYPSLMNWFGEKD